jgi:hypothetical protein
MTFRKKNESRSIFRSFSLLFCLLFSILFSVSLHAKSKTVPRVSVLLGPPGYGAGDPNPITFQNPIEYEFQGVFWNTMEFRGSGLGAFAGYRATSVYRAYVSAGLGITYTSPGIGGNIYFALGHDIFCKKVCVTAEIMNALGVAKGGYFSGLYRLQIGLSLLL